jgi:amidase
MDSSDLTTLGAAELVRRVHDGLSCAVDVAEAHLERIAADDTDGVLVAHDAERVLIEAGAVDTRHDRFALPLAGVPVAVADTIDVSGFPTRHGSAGTSDEPARRDDELVKRLRAAGAVVIGKTRTSEFGADQTSSGAAEAVAGRFAALAIGTDAGGGLRVPAARLGLVAVKPGSGVVPLPRGVETIWRGLGEVGVLAHHAGDAALALAALAGAPVDAGGAAPERVALSLHDPVRYGRLHPDQRAAVVGAAARLRAWPGAAAVVLADPPYPRGLGRAWRRRRRAGLAADRAQLTDAPQRRATLVAPRAATAAAWRARITAWFDEGGFELLICPAVPGPAHTSFAQAWNLAGLPAVVAPMTVGGRPAAVQLVGRAGSEAALLTAAALLEQRCVPAVGAAEPRVYA